MSKLSELIACRSPNLYVAHREGKGRCVFAARDFRAGELVSEEHATNLLDNKTYQQAQTSKEFPATLDAFFEVQTWPEVLNELHGFIGPDSKRQFLEPCKPETKRRVAILEANQFDFASLDAIGLGAFSAMFNHSCFPNVVFSSEGDLLRMYARTAIRKDEEMCIQYCPTLRHSIGRLTWMESAYGFRCDCMLCQNLEGDVLRVFPCPNCADGFALAGSWECKSCKHQFSKELQNSLQTIEEECWKSAEEQGFFVVMLDSRVSKALHRGHILMRRCAEDAAAFARGVSMQDIPRLRKAFGKEQTQSLLGTRFMQASSKADLVETAIFFSRMAVDQIRWFYEFMAQSLGKRFYSPELASALVVLGQDYLSGCEAAADPFAMQAYAKDASSCFREAKLLTLITHGTSSSKFLLASEVVKSVPQSFTEYKRISDDLFSKLGVQYSEIRKNSSSKFTSPRTHNDSHR
eukprot:ANDGO_08122.mRNA.1 hypothetical protein